MLHTRHMRKVLVLLALLFVIPLSASAHGHRWHSNGHQQRHYGQSQNTPTPTPGPIPVPTPVPTPTPNPSTPGELAINAYVTGYSYWDNTPPGSADISNPVIHGSAGGVGTYQDPITLAVGHSISNGRDTLDYPAGTKFYFPFLKKYVIVEDSCGDGGSPQNGPCHTGYQGHVWIDVYVGKGASKASSDNCMDKITEVHQVIKDPLSTYPVVVGEIAANCTTY